MPSPNFDLAPEDPEEQQPRRRRFLVTDESGARPLPAGAYDSYEPYDVDPLDEEVELPGVSRQAGTFFGIGVGLGIAVIAVMAGLYLGGYVGRPALAAGPAPLPLEPDYSLFEEAQNVEALALARIAFMPRLLTPTTETNSPDIQVIDQAPALTEPQDVAPTPRSPAPSNISNELDALERSMPPRGPVAPKEPTTDQAPSESPPLPAPAQPTAPAETSAPDTIPPPADRTP
jgi:hypothetical protein